jgi:hypothetical protein
MGKTITKAAKKSSSAEAASSSNKIKSVAENMSSKSPVKTSTTVKIYI